MEEWHEVVADRGRLWQRLLTECLPDSRSDRVSLHGSSAHAHRGGGGGKGMVAIGAHLGDRWRYVDSMNKKLDAHANLSPLESSDLPYSTSIVSNLRAS